MIFSTVRDSALRPQKPGKCSKNVSWLSLVLISEGVAKLGPELYAKFVLTLIAQSESVSIVG